MVHFAFARIRENCQGHAVKFRIHLSPGTIMKLNTIGGLAISTLLIAVPLSVASAADMALKAPPPPPAPVYGWSACYIGANTGGAWARKSTVVTSIAGIPFTESEGSTRPSGGAIGGQVGCDYQVNSFLVLGVRGMWDGANITGSNSWPAPPTNSNNYKIDSFGTAVAKVGILVSPAVELYAVGGAAWVHDKLNITSSVFGPFWTGDQTRTGYDAGVGITWMFAPKWDLWVEYDHMGFGTKNMSLAGVGILVGTPLTVNVTQNVDKVLFGIDYRITWASAPAATPLITK
jgi:outer membrane immunogenic protein